MDRRHTTAVVVPVKSFRSAKQRLDSVLDDRARAELARSMATGVVHAAHAFTVFVVAGDDEVATWAEALGAVVVTDPGGGLDDAAAAGVSAAATAGFDRVAVIHGDLPHVTAVALTTAVTADADVVVVPDRHGDGTNVCVVPTTPSVGFAYGPGSCRRHLDRAAALGLHAVTIELVDLGFDVDDPADLALVDPNRLRSGPIAAPVGTTER